jgi:hypothetical protein
MDRRTHAADASAATRSDQQQKNMTEKPLLWSDDPDEGAMTWYIRVPDSLRYGMRGRPTSVAQPPLDSGHLPALVALHGLLPHRKKGAPSGPDEVIASPAALSRATGVTIDTLYDWLDGIYELGGGGPKTTRLWPHARLERTFTQDNADLLEDEDDTGERWVVEVPRPATGAWLRVPAWWLWAQEHHTLLGGQTVKRRVMRRLARSPVTADWSSPGLGANPKALLGALIVAERLNHKAKIPQIHSWAVPTLAERWGLSTATVHRAFRAAEQAGYLACTRRTGGHGLPGKRRLILDPTDSPGETLPPNWGKGGGAGE